MSEELTLNEEKILEILTNFELQISEQLKDSNEELEQVKYYETFKMNEIDFEDIFITTQKSEDGKIAYHVYCQDASNELLSIDEDGNVEIKNPELEIFLNNIDLQKVIQENEAEPDRLRGISEKAKPEEMKKALKGEQEGQTDEEQQIEADLQEQGQDLEISDYKEIKDSYIAERMPEVFKKGEENGIAYSNKLNQFVIISKEDDKYKMNENIEPAKTTLRTIISIDENGEKIEKKIPHAMMDVPNNPDKKMAVIIGQYGIVDVETVDMVSGEQGLARPTRIDGQGLEGEESFTRREEHETEGIHYNRDIVEGANKIEKDKIDEEQEIEEAEETLVTVDNQKETDYIPNTKTTWKELMEETGESLPKLIERYNREMEKEGADSQTVVDVIVEDCDRVNHEPKPH